MDAVGKHSPIDVTTHIGRIIQYIDRLALRYAGRAVPLLAAAMILPFIRSVYWLGDEGIWLNASRLMLQHRIIYNDFFELHPPLGFLVVKA